MEPGRLSTDALASFAVFADHLSFTRAAEELHISQPALHVKVRKLSETLDVPLYTRHGRRLALTPAGERVARFARDLDARVSAFLSDVRGAAPARVPALAAGEGAYLYLLGDVVRPVHSAIGHPPHQRRPLPDPRRRPHRPRRPRRLRPGRHAHRPGGRSPGRLPAGPGHAGRPPPGPRAGPDPCRPRRRLPGRAPAHRPASRGAGTRPPRRRRPLDARRRG